MTSPYERCRETAEICKEFFHKNQNCSITIEENLKRFDVRKETKIKCVERIQQMGKKIYQNSIENRFTFYIYITHSSVFERIVKSFQKMSDIKGKTENHLSSLSAVVYNQKKNKIKHYN